MGYKVKWVEEHLGVTRKALRVFEKAGLMPENKDGKYRDYDDDDLDRIWTIRVLQGMGYSLKEITTMVSDAEFDFDTSISQKVAQLEEKIVELERHLGYAKTIKLTGCFPLRPNKMGEIKCDEFQKEAIEKWNVSGDPQGEAYAKLAETILSKPTEEWDNSDLGRMFSVLEMIKTMDPDLLLAESVLPKAICKRKALGANHPDIQLMVKLIYESQNALYKSQGMADEMTKKQFSRIYSSSYLAGDVAKLKTSEFSKEDCEFIVEAVSIFGDYKNFDELIEEGLRHGRRDENNDNI